MEENEHMEIERKFLVTKGQLPANLESYPSEELEQGYILTDPVIRIRKQNNTYVLTYKGPGFLKREEVEFPLNKEAYQKLLEKTEGNIIKKTRYFIPAEHDLTIELDVFSGLFEGLYLAEVEFPDEKTAMSYTPPEWFGEEATTDPLFHNATLSRMNETEITKLIRSLSC